MKTASLILSPSINAIALDAYRALSGYEADMADPEQRMRAWWWLKGNDPELAQTLIDLNQRDYDAVMQKVADLRQDPRRRQRRELCSLWWQYLRGWLIVFACLGAYYIVTALAQLIYLALFGHAMDMEIR